MQITTEQAELVLQTSILKARELGISVCIAILDSGGHLKALHRMDGAWLGVIDVAIKKAKTSALFEMETQTLDNYSKAGADAHGIELTNGHLVTFAGGIPLKGGIRLLSCWTTHGPANSRICREQTCRAIYSGNDVRGAETLWNSGPNDQSRTLPYRFQRNCG